MSQRQPNLQQFSLPGVSFNQQMKYQNKEQIYGKGMQQNARNYQAQIDEEVNDDSNIGHQDQQLPSENQRKQQQGFQIRQGQIYQPQNSQQRQVDFDEEQEEYENEEGYKLQDYDQLKQHLIENEYQQDVDFSQKEEESYDQGDSEYEQKESNMYPEGSDEDYQQQQQQHQQKYKNNQQQYNNPQRAVDTFQNQNQDEQEEEDQENGMQENNFAIESQVIANEVINQHNQIQQQDSSNLNVGSSCVDPSQTEFSQQIPKTDKKEDDSQTQEDTTEMQLIKPSKYYQQYLNGESLTNSYSILPNNQLGASTHNNTTGIIENLSSGTNQEVSLLKVKLLEANIKCMEERNNNSQLKKENQELQNTINQLHLQLKQAQEAVYENSNNQQSSTNNVFANTFGSIKTPIITENNNRSIPSNELQSKLEEEKVKNHNLKKDLEGLRTRLLQEMNNSGNSEQQKRDQENTIHQQQLQIQQNEQLLKDKTEELKKLSQTGDTFRIELNQLNSKFKKIQSIQDDIEAVKREMQIENQEIKLENKKLTTKLSNFIQDNQRLFTEIQSLKRKIVKAEGQVTDSKTSLQQYSRENEQQNNVQKDKRANHKEQQLEIELSELKQALQQTKRQLEAEKINKQQFKIQNEVKNEQQGNGNQKWREDIQTQKENKKQNRNFGHLQSDQDDNYNQYYHNQEPISNRFEDYQNNYAVQIGISNQDKKSYPIYSQQQQQQQQQYGQQQNNQLSVSKNRQLSNHWDDYQPFFSPQQNLNKAYQQQQYHLYPPNNQEQLTPKYQLHYQYNCDPQNQYDSKKQFSGPQKKQNKVDSPLRKVNKSNNLFYEDIEEEKIKLQKQPQFMPIGITSLNHESFLSSTFQIKELDNNLNKLLQEKKLVESELLKLEENKRKSSQIILLKKELEKKLNSLSLEVSSAKNQLRSLHALK